ncbi:MAG: helix-turn-helix domain-containing protein [Sporichthyaceae bacterium]
MDLSVAEAAERMGVDRSRVEQLLWSGRLAGRRAGRIWLVDGQSVADAQVHPSPPGRPMAPVRAWALLDLVAGGSAPWLPAVARSQVRARISGLAQADAAAWRALLRARSHVLQVRVHPGAVRSLLGDLGAEGFAAGSARAVELGADLVDLDPRHEVYVRSERWAVVAGRWHAHESAVDANLRVRLPRDVWPFGEGDAAIAAVVRAAVAADLLESAEPRAVAAGLAMLRDLLEQYRAGR